MNKLEGCGEARTASKRFYISLSLEGELAGCGEERTPIYFMFQQVSVELRSSAQPTNECCDTL
jgi:hypothetical protein